MPNRKYQWVLISLASLLSLKVFLAILWQYRWYFPPDFDASPFLSGRRYTFDAVYQTAFYGHLASSPLALILAVASLVTSRFRGSARWHRRLGYTQFVLVFVFVVPTSLMMSVRAYGGTPAVCGFVVQSLLTMSFCLLTAITAMRRSLESHRIWAIRLCLLLWSPILLRLIAGTLILLQAESQLAYQVNAWVSWLLPLALFETRGYWMKLPSQAKTTRVALAAHRGGFTLMELLVAVAIVGVILGLLLPAVRSSSEAARRMSCSNNFKQLGLGLHNYHSAFARLPIQMGGTRSQKNNGRTRAPGNNGLRLSGWVGVLPFIEQQGLWSTISENGAVFHQRKAFQPMGPAPCSTHYVPWRTEVSTLRCPSDPGIDAPALARTNYAFCLGDATKWIDTGALRWDANGKTWTELDQETVSASARGMMVPRSHTRFRDVLDGLSNTVLAAEIVTDLGDRDVRSVAPLRQYEIHDNPISCRPFVSADRPKFWTDKEDIVFGDPKHRRGFRWADGAAYLTGFNTILPPNRELCLLGDESGIGALPPSSRHQGGTHVLMGDGSVIFITDSIEHGESSNGTVYFGATGAQSPGTESPYGLWGAMGTRAQAEEMDDTIDW
ncbi:MAG: DUF1559 domain-containing protein [Planctomycetota bacterium]